MFILRPCLHVVQIRLCSFCSGSSQSTAKCAHGPGELYVTPSNGQYVCPLEEAPWRAHFAIFRRGQSQPFLTVTAPPVCPNMLASSCDVHVKPLCRPGGTGQRVPHSPSSGMGALPVYFREKGRFAGHSTVLPRIPVLVFVLTTLYGMQPSVGS